METELQIIPFTAELAQDFKRLNTNWIQKYFWVEPVDEMLLSNPKEQIIDKGGHIYFAILDSKVAGTYALISEGNGIFELSKMAVDESFQGKKIGNALLYHCIEEAKRLHATKVTLLSNTILQPAIYLYKKWGFKEVPLGSTEYKRANIKMELEIK